MTTGLPSPDAFSDTASQPDEQLASIPKTSAATQAFNSFVPQDSTYDHAMSASESSDCQGSGRLASDARTKISNLLKDKEREWNAVAEKKGPLRLLDLPMDVLKEIVKEVTHTNDLTALALTHSALHNLAIPHIYSRFDIVWPDAHATSEPRTGVDALTYGLATLCMGNVLVGPLQEQTVTCTACGTDNLVTCNHGFEASLKSGQRRLGNQYPQFTRKFSLGNGPADWVQEYLITKESGKMLGTLVALAVARMVNLETFVWDMPTGVLRDVWLALSSLQNRNPEQECRLERVWVRWHDNTEISMSAGQAPSPSTNATSQLLAGSTMTSVGWVAPAANNSAQSSLSQFAASSYAQSRVEYPTLSVLPALKSLSVLDIDELDYLDEMSVLIANSKDRLRELRVGISAKAVNREFVLAWDGPNLQQVDHKAHWPGASTIGSRRLGGVLGILLGRVFDIRKKQTMRSDRRDLRNSMASGAPASDSSLNAQIPHMTPSSIVELSPEMQAIPEAPIPNSSTTTSQSDIFASNLSSPPPVVTFDGHGHIISHDSNGSTIIHTQSEEVNGAQTFQSDIDSLTALISAHQIVPDTQTSTQSAPDASTSLPLRRSKSQTKKSAQAVDHSLNTRERLDGKLRLQTLELERVPLSVAVLQKAFDWSILNSLAILDCPQFDRLWSMLRKHFQPTPMGVNPPSAKHSSNTQFQYHLNLKKVHTDAACTSLILFLKETLAPNTLEVLFLQDRRRPASNITIDAIYRGPMKRHRGSLKKLMLDSSDKIPRGPINSVENTRWRAWMPTRDVLNFITSGRMSSLRELSIAIDYKDWHHFLQRLPHIYHLRSLNIPFVADHATPAFDPRELALQVVDVIVLRPEIELCYMGVSHKCFEILENRPQDDTHGMGDAHSSAADGGTGGVTDDDDEEDDDEEGSDEEEEDEEDDGTTAIAPPAIDPDETESELSEHDESDTDSWDGSDDGQSKSRLRLREILFYDDKVAIFKARHGKL